MGGGCFLFCFFLFFFVFCLFVFVGGGPSKRGWFCMFCGDIIVCEREGEWLLFHKYNKYLTGAPSIEEQSS